MRNHLKKAISQHKEKVQTNSFDPQTIISPEASLVLRPLSEAEVEYFQTQIGVTLKTRQNPETSFCCRI